MRSDPTDKHQQDHDEQHQAETATGGVSPTDAMRPKWQDPDEHQDKDDQKNGGHDLKLLRRQRILGVADKLAGARLRGADYLLDDSKDPVLVHLPGGSRAYGACRSALSVIACPVPDMSRPAPAVVWQAPSKGIAPRRMHIIKAERNLVYMTGNPLVFNNPTLERRVKLLSPTRRHSYRLLSR